MIHRFHIKEAKQADPFLNHMAGSQQQPPFLECLQFNEVASKMAPGSRIMPCGQGKDALPFFPNLSSRDLQKVSEEEGVRSGGTGSWPKAAGIQWEGDGEGAAAVSL